MKHILKIKEQVYWINFHEFVKHRDWMDWGAFDRERYWEKYPESKPDFPKPKVTKDYDKNIKDR